jgi:hypothetical protein
VRYFVIEYDRSEGRLVRCREYSTQRRALKERFALERQPGHAHSEIVVLAARSVDDLRRTHSRYFQSVSEMAERALA